MARTARITPAARAQARSATARALYHAVRRAGAKRGPLTNGYPRYGHFTVRDVERAARDALGGVPRGFGPAFERALDRVVRNRRERAGAGLAAPTLARRLAAHVARKVRAEAERRGLATAVDLARNGTRTVRHIDETRDGGQRVVLLSASGWADYGSGRRASPKSLCILGGWDDAGMWAVRVPGTVATAAEGLEWLMPAAVRQAREAGRTVLRQGDVWIVERRSIDAMDRADLPRNHVWDAECRVLRHRDGHDPVHVPFPAAVFAQRTLEATGAGRRGGD